MPSPVTNKLPACRSAEDLVPAGPSATTGQRPVAATGLGRWRAPQPATPAAGRKRGVRGGTAPRQPPQGDARSVAPRSKLLVSHNHVSTGTETSRLSALKMSRFDGCPAPVAPLPARGSRPGVRWS